MRRRAPLLLAAPAALFALAAAAEEHAEVPEVPSGQILSLFEVIHEDGLQRWRFLAPGVRGHDIDAVLEDMQVLCDDFVLPRLAEGTTPDEIVVSLMDRVVEFGESDPDARQHFEAYRVESGLCIWEVF